MEFSVKLGSNIMHKNHYLPRYIVSLKMCGSYHVLQALIDLVKADLSIQHTEG